jgi:hypothetical protein
MYIDENQDELTRQHSTAKKGGIKIIDWVKERMIWLNGEWGMLS